MNLRDYDRGYRDGVRDSITYLHRVAHDEMNDPHAKSVLNMLGFWIGVRLSQRGVLIDSKKKIRARTWRLPPDGQSGISA